MSFTGSSLFGGNQFGSLFGGNQFGSLFGDAPTQRTYPMPYVQSSSLLGNLNQTGQTTPATPTSATTPSGGASQPRVSMDRTGRRGVQIGGSGPAAAPSSLYPTVSPPGQAPPPPAPYNPPTPMAGGGDFTQMLGQLLGRQRTAPPPVAPAPPAPPAPTPPPPQAPQQSRQPTISQQMLQQVMAALMQSQQRSTMPAAAPAGMPPGMMQQRMPQSTFAPPPVFGKGGMGARGGGMNPMTGLFGY